MGWFCFVAIEKKQVTPVSIVLSLSFGGPPRLINGRHGWVSSFTMLVYRFDFYFDKWFKSFGELWGKLVDGCIDSILTFHVHTFRSNIQIFQARKKYTFGFVIMNIFGISYTRQRTSDCGLFSWGNMSKRNLKNLNLLLVPLFVLLNLIFNHSNVNFICSSYALISKRNVYAYNLIFYQYFISIFSMTNSKEFKLV